MLLPGREAANHRRVRREGKEPERVTRSYCSTELLQYERGRLAEQTERIDGVRRAPLVPDRDLSGGATDRGERIAAVAAQRRARVRCTDGQDVVGGRAGDVQWCADDRDLIDVAAGATAEADDHLVGITELYLRLAG